MVDKGPVARVAELVGGGTATIHVRRESTTSGWRWRVIVTEGIVDGARFSAETFDPDLEKACDEMVKLLKQAKGMASA